MEKLNSITSNIKQWLKPTDRFSIRDFGAALCWLIVNAIAYGFICLLAGLALPAESNTDFFFITRLTFGAIAALIFLFYFAYKNISIQRIHNQPSYVFYAYFGFFLAPVIAPELGLLFFKFPLSVDAWLWLRFDFFLLGVVFYYCGISPANEQPFYYAPETTGIEKDQFGFSPSAQNVSSAILDLKEFVSVFALYGGMGFGKSSYARMVVEHIRKKEKILYTYISLTETNEEKDFSILFSERWCRAISENYPKISTVTGLSLMHSILRDPSYSYFTSAVDLFIKMDVPLLRTRNRKVAPGIKLIHEFASDEVAQIFGNVLEFKEKIWVIIIDEVERSLLKEIYRVIEVIERFKNIARGGLPVRIVFLLCVATEFNESLKTYVQNHETDNPFGLEKLIDYFLNGSSKSITQRIPLPPVTKEKYGEFALKELVRFCGEMSIPIEKEMRLNFIWPDPSRNYFESAEECRNFVMDQLTKEPPRIFFRCLQELEFFYRAYRNVDGVVRKDTVRFWDVLLLSYIKVKHFGIIDFFKDTMHFLVGQTSAQHLLEYLELKRLKDKGLSFTGWLAQKLHLDAQTLKLRELETLICALAYCYVDWYEGTSHKGDKALRYEGTLSNPYNLLSCLTFIAEPKDAMKEVIQIYRQHRVDKDILRDIANDQLLEYSRFLLTLKEANIQLNLNVAADIYRRVTTNQIKLQPRAAEHQTERDEAAYQFSFQILEALEHERKGEMYLSAEAKEAIELFKNTLSSQEVDTGFKFKLVRSYVDDTRQSDIHYRLNAIFKNIMLSHDKTVIDAIGQVFREANARYLNGKENVYEREENFRYVLYQLWSGDKEDSAEIEKIREAALRNLVHYPDALALYWEAFPYPAAARNLEETLSGNPFFIEQNTELYMPLKNLVIITRAAGVKEGPLLEKLQHWEKILLNESEKYYALYRLRDDSTLFGFWKRQKYADDSLS